MTDSPSEAGVTFSSFIEQAQSTEKKPERMIADDELLRRLIEFAASASALVDLYKKSLYNNEPISAHSFEARSARVLDSITRLQVSPQSSEFVDPKGARLLLAMIGIFTEAGELLEAMHPEKLDVKFSTIAILEELGDLNWYQAIAANELQATLETILTMNVAKLKKRYQNGPTRHDDYHRDKAVEQAAMDIHLPVRNPHHTKTGSES